MELWKIILYTLMNLFKNLHINYHVKNLCECIYTCISKDNKTNNY